MRIFLLGCEEGQKWMDYFKNFFLSKETRALSLTVVKIQSTGTKELENFNNYDRVNLKKNYEDLKEFSLVLAIVTPTLMDILMSNTNLTIDVPNSSDKKMLMMMCGVDIVKMFEIDQRGSTLSSRFKNYSDWVKLTHHQYHDIISIVDEYLKEENNDETRSTIEHPTNESEYVKEENFEDSNVYLEEEMIYDTYKCMSFSEDHYFQVTNEDNSVQENIDENNLDNTNISISNNDENKFEENIYLCTNTLNENKECNNGEKNIQAENTNNDEEDTFDYYNLDGDVLESDVQTENYGNNDSDSDNYIMIGATNSSINTDAFSKNFEKKAIDTTYNYDLDTPLTLSSVTDDETEEKHHYTYNHLLGSKTIKPKHSNQYLSVASQHKKRNSDNSHQTLPRKPSELNSCKEKAKSQIKRRETIKYKSSDFQKQKSQRGKQSLLINQPFKIFPSEIKCEEITTKVLLIFEKPLLQHVIDKMEIKIKDNNNEGNNENDSQNRADIIKKLRVELTEINQEHEEKTCEEHRKEMEKRLSSEHSSGYMSENSYNFYKNDDFQYKLFELYEVTSTVFETTVFVNKPGLMGVKMVYISNKDDTTEESESTKSQTFILDIFDTTINPTIKFCRPISNELIVEVSQIYIHFLNICFKLVQEQNDKEDLIRKLDSNLSSILRNSDDADQFSVRAFELFFRSYKHLPIKSNTFLPTILHLNAVYDLPIFTEALRDLPDAPTALSILNNQAMSPMQLASNNPNVSKIFESFEIDDGEKVDDESLDFAYVEPNKLSNGACQVSETSNKNDESEEVVCDNDESEDMFQKYGAKNKSDADVVKFMAQVKEQKLSQKDAKKMFDQIYGKKDDKLPTMPQTADVRQSKNFPLFSLFKKSNQSKSVIRKEKSNIEEKIENDTTIPEVPPRPPLKEQTSHSPSSFNHLSSPSLVRKTPFAAPNLPMKQYTKSNSTFSSPTQSPGVSSMLTDLSYKNSNENLNREEKQPPIPVRLHFKNNRQKSFPISSLTPMAVPRKASLPDSVVPSMGHFKVKLDTMDEAKEDNGYLVMSSMNKLE